MEMNSQQERALSALQRDITILSEHRFEDAELEESRRFVCLQFIRGTLDKRQINLVHKMAKPIRTKARRINSARRRQKHFVYAIHDGAFVKIGYAVNPDRRMAELQVSNPSELRLVESIECPTRSKAMRLERQIHRAVKDHHVRGEWFHEDAMSIFDGFKTQ